jgi:hypothetical protein
METIFGNNLASDSYAKGEHEPLAIETTETQNAPRETKDCAATNEQQEASPPPAPTTYSAATYSRTKAPPAKKAKVAPIEDPNAAIVNVMS